MLELLNYVFLPPFFQPYTPLTPTSQLRPCPPILQSLPGGCSNPVSPWGPRSPHPRLRLHFVPVSAISTALPRCPSPRFPPPNLSAIAEPSNVNLSLIYHLSSSRYANPLPFVRSDRCDSVLWSRCLFSGPSLYGLLFIIICLSGS